MTLGPNLLRDYIFVTESQKCTEGQSTSFNVIGSDPIQSAECESTRRNLCATYRKMCVGLIFFRSKCLILQFRSLSNPKRREIVDPNLSYFSQNCLITMCHPLFIPLCPNFQTRSFISLIIRLIIDQSCYSHIKRLIT